MTQPETVETDVQRWLAAIGVESLCEWDVLVFLYRHQTILMSPGHLAHLMGYEPSPVSAALDTLAAHELVEVSPQSIAAAQLYRFTAPLEAPQGDALKHLLALSEHR